VTKYPATRETLRLLWMVDGDCRPGQQTLLKVRGFGLNSGEEKPRNGRIWHETSPDLSYQPIDEPINWFEITLYAETSAGGEEDPAVRELRDLARLLMAHVGQELETHLSQLYWTLKPAPEGAPEPVRKLRSLSLIVSGMEPYLPAEQPELLTGLLSRLSLLGVPALATTPDREETA
jgi:hypothetical protein